MAFKSAAGMWESGGAGGIQIPDRMIISCPKCGKELGKDVQLFFYEGLAGQLDLGVICCTDGEVRESPSMETI